MGGAKSKGVGPRVTLVHGPGPVWGLGWVPLVPPLNFTKNPLGPLALAVPQKGAGRGPDQEWPKEKRKGAAPAHRENQRQGPGQEGKRFPGKKKRLKVGQQSNGGRWGGESRGGKAGGAGRGGGREKRKPAKNMGKGGRRGRGVNLF